MNRWYEIDFVRFFLIIAVILVHIVNFGNVHPETKSVILSFLMPTFLLITGYLVNVEKSKREFTKYLIRLFLPYAIMVIGYSVLSFYLPVQDGLTEMSLKAIMTKVFITSIGPYWFLQTMIVCGIIYYACFHFLRSHLELISILYILCIALIIIADHSPVLSIKAIPYYFLGATLRLAHVGFNDFFKKSPFAILPIIILLLHDDMRDWGSIAILTVVYCLISFLSWLDLKTVYGKGSVGTQLLDSIGQTNRVLLNMQSDYNARLLAADIKTYFETNGEAIEVLIFKGNKVITVKRGLACNPSFNRLFRKLYEK